MNETDDLFDDTEEENTLSDELYSVLAPKIKQFIAGYYGKDFMNKPPEVFLGIEAEIKEAMYLFSQLYPDLLYKNRTIRDLNEYDKALDEYIPEKKPIKWHVSAKWFDRDFSEDEDEDEDTYLEDSDPIDLTEDEKRAKEIIELADEIIDTTQHFASYMKTGYGIIRKEVEQYLEANASFELSILSAEGYIELESLIDNYFTALLENIYEIAGSETTGTSTPGKPGA